MMGQFEARFPTDRLYCKNHMWARRGAAPPRSPDSTVFRFGFSAYAVRLLQDVYFLEWCVDPGTNLRERQEIGNIESSKAESALYAPMPGLLRRFNELLLKDPSHINVDTYGEGWLFMMEGAGDTLLTPPQYLEHLAQVWPIAQRTIKGQMNE
ncbi:MAG: glycine cleavage system protein H [Planctomycetia bacterium]|nr:glycine cleavage system protein H [Planctomycetia bacterium]